MKLLLKKFDSHLLPIRLLVTVSLEPQHYNHVGRKSLETRCSSLFPSDPAERYVFKVNNKYTAKTSMEIPANIYLFKVNNRNTRKSGEICSKLIIKTLE